uniref:Uncharacterized protein n=1 Tax=Anopheles atroparvus TaxID=41427 RepID=A0A182JJT6_ANOAO
MSDNVTTYVISGRNAKEFAVHAGRTGARRLRQGLATGGGGVMVANHTFRLVFGLLEISKPSKRDHKNGILLMRMQYLAPAIPGRFLVTLYRPDRTPESDVPGENIWIVRPGERLLELLELEAGEGRPVAALLPLRREVVPAVVAVRVGVGAVRVAAAAAHQLAGAGGALVRTALRRPRLVRSDVLRQLALVRYAHWSTGLL